MKTLAFALDLVDDPDVIARYDEYHRHVWPEVMRAQKAEGVISQRIFRSGNRLFMVVEVPDDYDWDEHNRHYFASAPKTVEWDNLMRTMQRPVPAAKPGKLWSPMPEVYNLNDQLNEG